ncbi:rCG41750 [Rattus norvegicus]|uniref:RCG41750 n=1 Tax=Rattus norvegicus TaxID=10116 RepID=A6KU60_RAT|nr:rCG41750 [Rattus norvegicus]
MYTHGLIQPFQPTQANLESNFLMSKG